MSTFANFDTEIINSPPGSRNYDFNTIALWSWEKCKAPNIPLLPLPLVWLLGFMDDNICSASTTCTSQMTCDLNLIIFSVRSGLVVTGTDSNCNRWASVGTIRYQQLSGHFFRSQLNFLWSLEVSFPLTDSKVCFVNFDPQFQLAVSPFFITKSEKLADTLSKLCVKLCKMLCSFCANWKVHLVITNQYNCPKKCELQYVVHKCWNTVPWSFMTMFICLLFLGFWLCIWIIQT